MSKPFVAYSGDCFVIAKSEAHAEANLGDLWRFHSWSEVEEECRVPATRKNLAGYNIYRIRIEQVGTVPEDAPPVNPKYKAAMDVCDALIAGALSEGAACLNHIGYYRFANCLSDVVPKLLAYQSITLIPATGADSSRSASPEAKKEPCRHLGTFRGETCKACGELVL